MPAHTVLVIEDDKDMVELLSTNLKTAGYQVTSVRDGITGLENALRNPPDLILLDIVLPGMLGTDVCRALRKNRKLAEIPIIMISARNDEIDRIVGFELGADDYVVKPFSVRELLLRVQAVLRRGPNPSTPAKELQNGPVSICTEKYQTLIDGVAISLTTIEFKLLLTLMERQGTVQSREDLLTQVWGFGYTGESRTVDTHITRLRSKMGASGALIRTIRGFGYTMELSEE